MNDSTKVTSRHLARRAYLYVRQSTLRQVVEHEEGRLRQYQLRERARQLGWPEHHIQVIDCDLGQSGASSNREGFQQLVAEVGLGKAGLVMGLEVSRLARNSTDWHRLLEICALSDTLILDEDGVYDPQQFNDRLLLGLKGTISEAELHVIRARLQGGIRNKAMRGELRTPLPVGFVYDERHQVVLDPDQQVQDAIRLFFRSFERIGSALGVVRHFARERIAFPHRKTHTKKVSWGPLNFSAAHNMLHNPRYAGIYFFGKSRQRRRPDGRTQIQWIKRPEWLVYQPGAHAGYLTVEQYERNLEQLRENGSRCGADRRRPAREGSALLQGIAICGRCGGRMRTHYYHRGGELVPSYVCASKLGPQCQYVHGGTVDVAIEALILASVTPLTLELALEVHREVGRRIHEAHRVRQQRVERARYEAELARERFLAVDPRNRLVAANLELDWNERLREVAEAETELARQQQARPDDPAENERVLALATDFPRLWNDPHTAPREKKRLLRLLIEDVTLVAGRPVRVHVRFRGGATRSLEVEPPKNAFEQRRTPPETIRKIDELLEDHSEERVAQLLNEAGLRSGTGTTFSARMVANIRLTYDLPSRTERLKRRGCVTVHQAAATLRVGALKIKSWAAQGHIVRHHVAGRIYLYDISGHQTPNRLASKGGAL
ncbi:MAG TPA: recombinase family protein [Thermoanaerobaculia bacterium]|nr:recombinase family protein [Thermoanaerobaculia bacterium]